MSNSLKTSVVYHCLKYVDVFIVFQFWYKYHNIGLKIFQYHLKWQSVFSFLSSNIINVYFRMLVELIAFSSPIAHHVKNEMLNLPSCTIIIRWCLLFRYEFPMSRPSYLWIPPESVNFK